MERILLVEDYAPLRVAVVEFLAPHFDIICAADGREAMEQLETTNDFYIVVADYKIRIGPTGIEVLAHVRVYRPKAYRVLMSSHVGMPDFDQEVREICDPHLLVPKPPDMRSVRQWMLGKRLDDCAKNLTLTRP